jgi:LacI family transcriptional regulator
MAKYSSITDIAKALGLSPSTVSRALNDHYSISGKTKERVWNYAKETGFQKNLNAANLLHGKSRVIGVLVPEATSHFFATLISGTRNGLAGSGYDLIILESNESYEQEVRNLRYLCSMRVDGILYAPSVATTDFSHLDLVQKNKIPFVNIDREVKGFHCCKVLLDDGYGARLAVEHLIQRGARRIAHLAGPKEVTNAAQRLQAYKDVLQEHHIPFDPALVAFSDFRMPSSAPAITRLFDQKPEAIFCVNDETALGCMAEARKRKLQVPDDVLVVGFDDEIYSQYFNPGLTTVHSPIDQMAQMAVKKCLRLIQDFDAVVVERMVLQPELIIRKSSLRKNN